MQIATRTKHNGSKKTTRRPKKIVKNIALVNPTVIPIPPPDEVHTKGEFTLIWDNQSTNQVDIQFGSDDAVEDVRPFGVPKKKQHKNKAKKQQNPPVRYGYTVTPVAAPSKKDKGKGPPTIIIW